MSMTRFTAFTPKDLETVKAYEAAAEKDPDTIPADIAESYRDLVKDNFGKLMSTMIGEIARFFDITIKRKIDWNGFYGWSFSYHESYLCWYGISYQAENFLQTCFALKCEGTEDSVIQTLIDDEGYTRQAFGRDGSDWVTKTFDVDVSGIDGDEDQMTAFSSVAEDQLDILEM